MESLIFFAKKLHKFSGRILYVNFFAMGLVSLLEGIGILMLIPMLNISGILDDSSNSSHFSGIVKLFSSIPDLFLLPVILSIYLGIVVFQTLLHQKLALRNTKILVRFTNHLRLEIFSKLTYANWSFFIKRRKSDFVNALTDELSRVVAGTQLFLQLSTSIVFTFIQIAIAFWLSPQITLFVLLSGVMLALCSRHFIKKSKEIGNQTSEVARSYLGGITDHFNGMKDIKTNTLENSRITWLQHWCNTVEKEQLAIVHLRNRSQLFYKVSSAVIIALLIYISITLFQAQSAQLLLIILIFTRLWPRFTSIQSNAEQIASTLPALQSLIKLQEESDASKEGEKNNKMQGEPLLLADGIACEEVDFKYSDNQEKWTLTNINLEISTNRTTAIVGRSGAGKSTLVDLIMGLNKPTNGKIYVDESPITDDNLYSLRKSISYVSQDPFLFNGSIRDNLLMIENHASEKEIWQALEFSSAAEFVRRLPDGLDTPIGDRGVRLSGGERQRLVLARAILRKPSILVLDEATSALDSENERKIQEALEGLKGKMTIIVIAHRLSTIRNADQVIVLEEGRIVQAGGFQELASQRSGQFGRLLGNQVEAVQVSR
ncbi:ABC transporter ATP-binding protein [Metabacillus sp. 113a]|uniref:ABC transporter ATP-binding protein n=1 Tax=Metabacillus sp. 113a TaxID=3404706 RepID=UPI003CEEC5A0